jgi:thiaminase (transcriptional activator TenA)
LSLAATLWQESTDLAEEALRHPFVQGIGRGTLPRDAFRGFVAQDAFFLDAFARAYAMALVRSPDRASARTFAELVSGVREELDLHAEYAHEWDIDLDAVEPMPATLAYTDFLLSTATTGSPGEICAAMTPCMRLYQHLGSTLAAGGIDPGNPYRRWVETYADPGFDALAGRLEALLDALASDPARLRTPYRRAMRLEVAFFTAALDAGGG